MTSFYRIIYAISFLLINSSCAKAVIIENNLILERLAQSINEHPDNDVVQEAISYMNDDGSFKDIDYTITSSLGQRGWIPKYHLYRLVSIASACADINSIYYKNEETLNLISEGLTSWIQLNPKCSNWWMGTIHEPCKLGSILLLMEATGWHLDETLKATVLEKMKEAATSPNDYNDANRFDVALHWIYRACLSDDEDVLNIALKSIYGLLDISETGFQVDGSFFHDGNQFFIGSYCVNTVIGLVNLAPIFKNTAYEMPKDQLYRLREYFLNTYPYAARGGHINYDCVGRSFKPGVMDIDLRNCYQKMQEFDTEYANNYKLVLAYLSGDYLIPEYHHHFFKGDYTTHSRKDYNFSVKSFSTRTRQNESGNGENLMGYFLSNGNTCLTRTGREYSEIFALWDWNYVPGVTAPLLERMPGPRHNWGVIGSSTFAGGVSDSLYGVSVYSYYDDYNGMNTGANKGYFFFDDEIVCLGANIQSDHKVVTSVEQCWAVGDVEIIEKDGATCVCHNEVGYYFPSNTYNELLCRSEIVNGNWHNVDSNQKDSVISGKTFLLAINHNLTESQEYAYIVVPGKSKTEMEFYMTKGNVEIAANNDSIQAVRNIQLGIWEFIFYKGCTFCHPELEIKASRPCAIIFKYGNTGEPVMHVSDPGQTGEEIYLEIIDKKNGLEYNGTVKYDDSPKDYWGATKVIELERISTADLHSLEYYGKYYVYDVMGTLVGIVKSDELDHLRKVVHKSGVYFVKGLSEGIMRTQKQIVR